MSHSTTASPKASFRAPRRVGGAVVGRGNAGWTTSKSGHPSHARTAHKGLLQTKQQQQKQQTGSADEASRPAGHSPVTSSPCRTSCGVLQSSIIRTWPRATARRRCLRRVYMLRSPASVLENSLWAVSLLVNLNAESFCWRQVSPSVAIVGGGTWC